MQNITASRIIDMTGHFTQARRSRRRAQMHTVLALWTQYGAIGALIAYFLLRALMYPALAAGQYSGPLALLWPLSFLLLLTSYVSDLLLWQEDG